MTQDEIIELARQTGIRETIIQFRKLKLEAFAKLIAAKEREACAKYVESLMIGKTPLKVVMGAIGDAIRARGTRMMQDETIELARQAGVRDDENIFEFSQYKYLKRFAKLVAAKERERCAKWFESIGLQSEADAVRK
jgi:hypothetical protein